MYDTSQEHDSWNEWLEMSIKTPPFITDTTHAMMRRGNEHDTQLRVQPGTPETDGIRLRGPEGSKTNRRDNLTPSDIPQAAVQPQWE